MNPFTRSLGIAIELLGNGITGSSPGHGCLCTPQAAREAWSVEGYCGHCLPWETVNRHRWAGRCLACAIRLAMREDVPECVVCRS